MEDERAADGIGGGATRHPVLLSGEGYRCAVADAAGSTPWNLITAVAHDAVSYLHHGLAHELDSVWQKPQDTPVPVVHETCTPESTQHKPAQALPPFTLQLSEPKACSKPAQNSQQTQQPAEAAAEMQQPVADCWSYATDHQRTDSISSSYENSLEPSPVEATGRLAPQHNPGKDVTLRIESLTATQTRFVVLLMWFGLTVAMVFLWLEFALKIRDPDGATRSRDQPIMNLVCGCVCLCTMTLSAARFCRRVWLTREHKQVWEFRKRKVVSLYNFELLVQYVNIIVFIAANAHALTSWCNFFSHFTPWAQLIQWTCWNTVFLLHTMAAHNSCVWRSQTRGSPKYVGGSSQHHNHKPVEPALHMDAPLLQGHWPLLPLWAATECAIIAVIVYYAIQDDNAYPLTLSLPPGVAVGDCRRYNYSCAMSQLQIGLIAIMAFFPCLYFLVFSFYLRLAFVRLQREPYSEPIFKIGNLIVRLKVRLRLSVFSFFILSIVLLFFVKYSTCRSLADTWLGLLPLHIAETASAVCWSFLTMPRCPLDKPELLQGADAEQLRGVLSQQPMFCFETCMNMLYWSALVYDYQQAPGSQLSLEEAMSLYGLTHSELFWERASDTKMLMAWNRNTVVCAFRGTASINNAWSDLQAYPTTHMPRRGRSWARPRVHMGFQRCWMRNGFSQTVKDRIVSLLNSGELELGKVQFYVTGHSLGGALATLAAFAFCEAAREQGHMKQLPCACYTFGAPRTGNRDFAKEYEQEVPDTFHVINDQDAVPRSGKFLGLYKRGGHRVIINARGDMIVRPLPIEASMRQVPGGMSVSHHLLAAYTLSLHAIMASQYSSKRFKGGMAGVLRLAEGSAPVQRLLLEKEGWVLADLQHMLRWGPSKATRSKHAQRAKRDASIDSARRLSLERWTNLLLGKASAGRQKAGSMDEEAAPGELDQHDKGGILDLNDEDQQVSQAATAAAAKLRP